MRYMHSLLFNLVFSIGIDPFAPPLVVGFAISDSDTISQLSKVAQFQYSYPEHTGAYSTGNPNPKYFKSVSQGLEINLYPTDKPHHKDSKTLPRTELAFESNILTHDKYSFSFDHYISMYPTNEFGYCFAQVSGMDSPNVMLFYQSGKYQLLVNGEKAEVVGSPQDNIGKWVTWRIDFSLSVNGGYVSVFRNNALFLKLTGNTSGLNYRGTFYLKHGMYSQGAAPSTQVKSYTRNLKLVHLS